MFQEKHMRFGEFIRARRLQDRRELTLHDISEELGLSLSMLSDIEQGRRKPFDAEKIEIFCRYLNLSEEDRALMYDLAARDRGEIPSDIDDLMMHSEIGNMARFALRMTNAGVVGEKDWRAFIDKIQEKRGGTK